MDDLIERLRALARNNDIGIGDEAAKEILILHETIERLEAENEALRKELDCGCGVSGCRNVKRKCAHCTEEDFRARIEDLGKTLQMTREERDEAFAKGYLDEGRNWKKALDALRAERDEARAVINEAASLLEAESCTGEGRYAHLRRGIDTLRAERDRSHQDWETACQKMRAMTDDRNTLRADRDQLADRLAETLEINRQLRGEPGEDRLDKLHEAMGKDHERGEE